MTYHESSPAVLKCSSRAATLLKFLIQKANNETHSSFWRISKIIAACGFSRSTYHRAIKELVRLNLVEVKERSELCGRQKSNEFILNITELSEKQGTAAPKIKVANNVQLKGMSYKIYLFLKAKCGKKGYRISSKEIAQACRISVSTARRYVRLLEQKGYIKRGIQIRENGGFGFSFYQITAPIKTKIARLFAFISVFKRDTLPTVTGGTPRTISKFKLNKSKVKEYLRYIKAKRKDVYTSKFVLIKTKLVMSC